MKNISIVGDGAMGSVCAMMLCQKHYAVRMWGYDAKQLGEIQNRKENFKFLPGYKLPDELAFESRDSEILKNADLIVSAVPCQYMRSVFARLKSHFNGTLLRPSQILADVLGGDVKVIALSGPTIADELVRKLPATATAACQDEQLAKVVQDIFTMPYFRIYRNTDIIGVELAGAMKNVIAIAAGIVDGIKVGDNAKAALLCRGLAEITRLGLSLGAKEQTFFGLSGLGDLVTTCISPLGRNRIFGQRIGTGQSVKEALGATMSVVEGAATCKSIVELAKTRNIDMPITESVYQILFCGKGVLEAIEELMKRKLKAE